LRMNGFKFQVSSFKFQVESESAHKFLMGLLEASDFTYKNLLPWVRKSIVNLK